MTREKGGRERGKPTFPACVQLKYGMGEMGECLRDDIAAVWQTFRLEAEIGRRIHSALLS